MELALPGRLERAARGPAGTRCCSTCATPCRDGHLAALGATARQAGRRTRTRPHAGAGRRRRACTRSPERIVTAGGARRAVGRRASERRPLRRLLASRRCRWPGCCARSCSRDRTVVLTSATLELGGDFDRRSGRPGLASTATTTPALDGLDVGSPFDYPQPGHPLRRPAPAAARPRRPADAAMLDELAELVEAAGGRTLGLFSSHAGGRAGRRGDARAARRTRSCCQGDDTLGELIKQLRRGPGDLPVRHAVAVAGRRRARARPASWWSSTASRSRARTTR